MTEARCRCPPRPRRARAWLADEPLGPRDRVPGGVLWYAAEGAPLWAIERAIAAAGEQQQIRVLPLPPGVVVPGLG
jgi:hypothetical protein